MVVLDVVVLDVVVLDLAVLDAVDSDVEDSDVEVVSGLVSVLYKKNVPLLVLRRGIPIFSVKVNAPFSTYLPRAL